MSPDEQWKKNILGLIDDMRQTNKELLAKGIDARDPGDRQALRIIQRIERKIKGKQKPKTKGLRP